MCGFPHFVGYIINRADSETSTVTVTQIRETTVFPPPVKRNKCLDCSLTLLTGRPLLPETSLFTFQDHSILFAICCFDPKAAQMKLLHLWSLTYFVTVESKLYFSNGEIKENKKEKTLFWKYMPTNQTFFAIKNPICMFHLQIELLGEQ